LLAYRLGPAEVRFTGRAEGDLSAHAGTTRAERERAVIDREWRTAKQVHGANVAVVDAATDATAVGEADALITSDPRVAVAVRTADCPPVALAGAGVVGVVHAGWRGLAAGVLARAVDAMRTAGAERIEAALGPCVRAECYEFGPRDLDTLAASLGDGVRATTASGMPALDLPAAVRAALRALHVPLVHDAGVCTACAVQEYWSHRARGERERQATVVWLA